MANDIQTAGTDLTHALPEGMDGPCLYDNARRILSTVRLVPEDNRAFPGFLFRPVDDVGATVEHAPVAAQVPVVSDERASFEHVDLTGLDLTKVRDIEECWGLHKARLTDVKLTREQIWALLREYPQAYKNYVEDNWHARSGEDYGRYNPIDLNGFDATGVSGFNVSSAFHNTDLTGMLNFDRIRGVRSLNLQGAKLTREQLKWLCAEEPEAFKKFEKWNAFYGCEPGTQIEMDCDIPWDVMHRQLPNQQTLYGLDLTRVKNIHLWPDWHNSDVRQTKLTDAQLRELFVHYPTDYYHWRGQNPGQNHRLNLDGLDILVTGDEHAIYADVDLRGVHNIEHAEGEFYSSGKVLLTPAQLDALGRAQPKKLRDYYSCNPLQVHLDGLDATMTDFGRVNLEGRDLTRVFNLEKSLRLELAYLAGATLSPQQLRTLFVLQPLAFARPIPTPSLTWPDSTSPASPSTARICRDSTCAKCTTWRKPMCGC